MNIPFQARTVDLINLLVSKGSNFLLTALLFSIISGGMSSSSFGEFGYWWSIAIMIGGVLLGGCASALVRVVSIHSSFKHLIAPLKYVSIGFLFLSLLCLVLWLALSQYATQILMVAVVALFGLSVQLQATVLTLLRAAQLNRLNFIASSMSVLLIPLSYWALIGNTRTLPHTFLILACSFFAVFCLIGVISYKALGYLLAGDKVIVKGVKAFLADTTSFTAINIFSYVAVTVDFTIFRLLGSPQDFATMATGKIFFERFVLPLLMVFASAVSLQILRQPKTHILEKTKIEVRIGSPFLLALLTITTLTVLAYFIFIKIIRNDLMGIPIVWLICVSFGYIFFVINGVLLDLFVVKRPMRIVIAHVFGFMLFGGLLQWVLISNYGVPGWAFGWLILNIAITAFLARDCLHLSI